MFERRLADVEALAVEAFRFDDQVDMWMRWGFLCGSVSGVCRTIMYWRCPKNSSRAKFCAALKSFSGSVPAGIDSTILKACRFSPTVADINVPRIKQVLHIFPAADLLALVVDGFKPPIARDVFHMRLDMLRCLTATRYPDENFGRTLHEGSIQLRALLVLRKTPCARPPSANQEINVVHPGRIKTVITGHPSPPRFKVCSNHCFDALSFQVDELLQMLEIQCLGLVCLVQ